MVLWFVCAWVVKMEILPLFGISTELSREEFMRRLCRDSTRDQVQGLRASLFLAAVDKGLADTGDRLVGRKKVGGGKTAKEKYAEDTWTLVGVVQRCEAVPRILLKNGKRAKEDWLRSQDRMKGQKGVGVEGAVSVRPVDVQDESVLGVAVCDDIECGVQSRNVEGVLGVAKR